MDQTLRDPGACSVLVVDDEVTSQELARLALRHIGIGSIEVFSSAAPALRAIRHDPPYPDFIVCDIFMPHTDGIEFVNELVTCKFRGGLVLVTGGSTQFLHIAKKVARFHGLNLLASLTKPLLAEDLQHAFFGNAAIRTIAPPDPSRP